MIPNELNHLREKDNLIRMFETIRPSDGPAKSSVKMYFSKFDFISLVFSPFLEGLTFFSKKELDFKDWLIVTQLKLRGLHLTPECRDLISFICDRMNSNRLSTNLNSKNTLTKKSTIFYFQFLMGRRS